MKVLQVFIITILSSFNLSSQSITLTVDRDKMPEITVSGGSTLHDWKVQSATILGYPEELSIDPTDVRIGNFSFQVEVKSMDGGRGATMNNKTYKALLADTHPMIMFEQEGVAKGTNPDDEGKFSLNSEGWLTVAGVRKQVKVAVSGSLKDGGLTLEGYKNLLMSDFNIDPPSAMFGQIQTKNELTISFSFSYVAK